MFHLFIYLHIKCYLIQFLSEPNQSKNVINVALSVSCQPKCKYIALTLKAIRFRFPELIHGKEALHDAIWKFIEEASTVLGSLIFWKQNIKGR